MAKKVSSFSDLPEETLERLATESDGLLPDSEHFALLKEAGVPASSFPNPERRAKYEAFLKGEL
jgi:hypothetical protein